MPGFPADKRVPISELSVGAIVFQMLLWIGIATFIIGITIGQGLQQGFRTTEWLTVTAVSLVPILVLWSSARELWRRGQESKMKQHANDDDD